MRFFAPTSLVAGVALASAACAPGSAASGEAPDAGLSAPVPNGGACGDNQVCVDFSVADATIVVRGAGLACPAGYRFEGTWVQLPKDPVPPAQCSCECGAPAKRADCTSKAVAIGVSLDTTCDKPSAIAAGICQTTLAGDAAYAKATPLPPKQGPCDATVKKITSPIAKPETFRTCTMPSIERGPCNRSSVCVPREPPPDAAACVRWGGSGGCPADHPNALPLAQEFRDERACTACSCETTDTCANPRLEFHDAADPNCTKAPQTTVPADGLCHPTGYTTSWLEYHADVVASPSCQVTEPSMPMGSVHPVAAEDTVVMAPRQYCCR